MANEQARMNPEVKAKWVAALRSGEYRQGRERLRTGDAFCCFGVLCNVHAQEHPDIAAREMCPGDYMGSTFLPSDEVLDWAGLNVSEHVHIRNERGPLYEHNDAGRTFAEIADAIESQL
jgi:hypothetical protein